jgi:DNA-binding NtrC family response regulator
MKMLDHKRPVALERGKILFEDPGMRALERTIVRLAGAPVSVLVLGETGAGKDVVAGMLHEFSPRANRPFLALNCASLPEALLESELFGHERGAFTGAVASKPGLLEGADGGSVFLDEVGDLPLSLQAKLLRVVETREVTRLGALKPRAIDVRFIAATNHELARDVAEGRFRRDLYYRLNSVTLTVPPLRDRPCEIEPLARLFLEEACIHFEAGDIRFSVDAIAALCAHSWPGNVRELKSTVERAALLACGRCIEPADLQFCLADEEPISRSIARSEATYGTADERARIMRALDECGGNQSRAAKLIGMPRRTLVRKIALLGLPRPREKTYFFARDEMDVRCAE